jgi:probable FeS assembly SUF system protein SufT
MRPGQYAPVTLERDCEATLIPGGERVTLFDGEEVIITQSLGGSFTVQTSDGYLVRIGAEYADALGREPVGTTDPAGATEAGDGPAETGPFAIAQVIEQLKAVFDPEIPVNVVDLGLIYACDAEVLPQGGHRVEIKMSMTAPGCGMGDVLRQDAIARVRAVPGVTEVDIELVWDPPWDMSRMSDAARLQLGF